MESSRSHVGSRLFRPRQEIQGGVDLHGTYQLQQWATQTQ